MGGFLGFGYGKESANQETNLDPLTKNLNLWRVTQLNNLYGSLGQAQEMYQRAIPLSPQAGALAEAGTNIGLGSAYSVPNPREWYTNTRSDILNRDLFSLMPGAQDLASGYRSNLGNYISGISGNLSGFGNAYDNLIAMLQQSNADDIRSTFGGLTDAAQAYGSGITQALNAREAADLAQLERTSGALSSTANRYFRDILGPEIGSKYSLLGLARSGARQEAEARAAGELALPISQQAFGAEADILGSNRQLQAQTMRDVLNIRSALGEQMGGLIGNINQQGTALRGQGALTNQQLQAQNLQNYFPGLGSTYEALSGLYGTLGAQQAQQQGQNLFSLNMNYPSIDTAVRQAQLGYLGTGLNFADYQRAGSLGSWGNLLGNWNALLTGQPYIPATGTSTSGSAWNLQGKAGMQIPGFGPG